MTSFTLPRHLLAWLLPLLTTCIWCLAAASAGYWALRFPWGAATLAVPALQDPRQGQAQSPDVAALQRAFGAAPLGQTAPDVQVAMVSRFQLLGVVAGASGQGSALIATDGQPPKAYAPGQTVSEGVVLQSVGHLQARLGGGHAQGTASFTLTMPALVATEHAGIHKAVHAPAATSTPVAP
jgi:general secretion pathway protein C